ncbi:MAG: Peptidase M50 [candidate division CPR1 bacterium GW2011_GWC1_49_13]|uniref:Peptidase M50 n=1 Tax=candidate division CPR1 bacterium GW2011_GWC1_49_13 TaxID=1618342 RepID=A0A0G1YFT0_9BACT|nr:MAG: Peptidase M50 [candidate division CPR1 bacterium GW2011_GWC1_49_13]
MNFSKEEIRDLTKAWLAISVAVAVAFLGRTVESLTLVVLVRGAVIYGLTVGVAFLAHEVFGHKLTAQRFGIFAEFRADDFFLLLALVFAFFTGFVFAAPGAVVIGGVTRVDTYGKIAAAGPLVNIFLAILFLFLARSGISLILPLVDSQGIDLVSTSFQINAWLALFNLLPLGILDGAKVLAWNKGIWATLGVASLILLFGF